jgi:hypothetical protein
LTIFAPSCLLKKGKLTLTKTIIEAKKIFYADQCLDRLDNQTLAEKMRLLLLPKLALKNNKPILKTYANKPRTKPKP